MSLEVVTGGPSRPPVAPPTNVAKQAGLRYVGDHLPGVRRRRSGKHFSYRDDAGNVVKDKETLARIRKLASAIETVAGRLGNTASICRRCYIHPEIFKAYLDGSLMEELRTDVETTLTDDLAKLSLEEVAVLAFFRKRLSA